MRRFRRLLETLLLRQTVGLGSRLRIAFYRGLGMKIGRGCRMEAVRVRRPGQIRLGDSNALTDGCWLWPLDNDCTSIRIRVGANNYFNRDVMIDACNSVEIGDQNMFGPGVYITDSNHTMPSSGALADAPMDVGRVVVGNGCWIGAKAAILKDVVLGDRCIVAAGAVVTKSFPSGSVVAGVPARLLQGRSSAAAAGSGTDR